MSKCGNVNLAHKQTTKRDNNNEQFSTRRGAKSVAHKVTRHLAQDLEDIAHKTARATSIFWCLVWKGVRSDESGLRATTSTTVTCNQQLEERPWKLRNAGKHNERLFENGNVKSAIRRTEMLNSPRWRETKPIMCALVIILYSRFIMKVESLMGD